MPPKKLNNDTSAPPDVPSTQPPSTDATPTPPTRTRGKTNAGHRRDRSPVAKTRISEGSTTNGNDNDDTNAPSAAIATAAATDDASPLDADEQLAAVAQTAQSLRGQNAALARANAKLKEDAKAAADAVRKAAEDAAIAVREKEEADQQHRANSAGYTEQMIIQRKELEADLQRAVEVATARANASAAAAEAALRDVQVVNAQLQDQINRASRENTDLAKLLMEREDELRNNAEHQAANTVTFNAQLAELDALRQELEASRNDLVQMRDNSARVLDDTRREAMGAIDAAQAASGQELQHMRQQLREAQSQVRDAQNQARQAIAHANSRSRGGQGNDNDDVNDDFGEPDARSPSRGPPVQPPHPIPANMRAYNPLDVPNAEIQQLVFGADPWPPGQGLRGQPQRQDYVSTINQRQGALNRRIGGFTEAAMQSTFPSSDYGRITLPVPRGTVATQRLFGENSLTANATQLAMRNLLRYKGRGVYQQ